MSVSQGYLLSCAEGVASQSDSKPIPDCLHWLFTPLGRQFFLSCDWSVKSESREGVYTSQRDPGMDNKVNRRDNSVYRNALMQQLGLLIIFPSFFLSLPLADPIAQLHRCFCEKLLERAVHSLIQPHTDTEAGKPKNDSG